MGLSLHITTRIQRARAHLLVPRSIVNRAVRGKGRGFTPALDSMGPHIHLRPERRTILPSLYARPLHHPPLHPLLAPLEEAVKACRNTSPSSLRLLLRPTRRAPRQLLLPLRQGAVGRRLAILRLLLNVVLVVVLRADERGCLASEHSHLVLDPAVLVLLLRMRVDLVGTGVGRTRK